MGQAIGDAFPEVFFNGSGMVKPAMFDGCTDFKGAMVREIELPGDFSKSFSSCLKLEALKACRRRRMRLAVRTLRFAR